MTPGPHTVAVTLHYRGNGMGIFPYFEGYRFIVRSSTTINVSAARQTRIVVRAVSQGDITTRVRDKPSVRFDVQSGSLGDTKR